jgi:hypothetical protein
MHRVIPSVLSGRLRAGNGRARAHFPAVTRGVRCQSWLDTAPAASSGGSLCVRPEPEGESHSPPAPNSFGSVRRNHPDRRGCT